MLFNGFEGVYSGRIGVVSFAPKTSPYPPLEVEGRKVLYTAIILAPEFRGKCMPLHPACNDDIALLVHHGDLAVAPYGTIVKEMDKHAISIQGEVYYNQSPSGFFMRVDSISKY